ncbi:Not1-domain-containing protein [Rhizopus microsporus]|uniref:General negative regulator of transcription subunit 1 n=1 Tax=Rhizopus microsporus TaxID=58291 RepID=A0A1X0SGL0_RHIZD|nr:Not1-domain-containing protein [Rhizopus microsporus]
MVYAPTDLLDLNKTVTKKVIPEDLITALPVSMRQAASQLAIQQLNCLDLLDAIMNLVGTAATDDIKVLMDRLAIQAPELLMIGLAQIQPIKNELHRALFPKLLNIFLIGHVNSPFVIRCLWHVQPNLLLEGFFEMYKKDPTLISRIFDISQEAKIIVNVLKADLPFFTLDLASLAARRQNLNLEKWLTDRLSKEGFPFYGACIDFLEKKCAIEMARQSRANVIPTLQLSVEVIRIFFKVLTERPLPPAETAKLSKLSQLYAQLYPQLNDNRVPMEKKPNGGETGEGERNYPDEVEEMVRLYFERLYTKDITAARFASVLKACRSSNDPRQASFFACATHTLLDESRFFSQYPESELLATGELLGMLIELHLISYSHLRGTLKLILDALKHPIGSKMFNFGVQALTQFRNRLSEWPQYTLLLSKIEGLRNYPVIVEAIATTLKQLAQKDPEGKTAASETGGEANERTSETSAANTTLLQSSTKQAYEIPPEKTQERVSFLINNLSVGNLKSKSSELKDLLQAPNYGWFSHYLVVRRVSIEPNNHELYSSLLDELDLQGLNDAIIEETYANINVLLQSDNIVNSSSDKNLLKNLGTWLGRLTIAKNKPIRYKDLSFKDLLISAYEKNRLTVVIPLVCKVLQHAAASKIFKPPNPWLMSTLKLLAELYWTEGLKLTMKFEIELLYKALELDLNEIEPSSVLEKYSPQANQVVAEPSAAVAPTPSASTLSAALPVPRTSSVDANEHQASSTAVSNSETTQNPRLDVDVTPILAKLQVNPAVAQLMMQHPVIKSIIYAGISEAFTEVAPSIIMTSANIAALTTKEMILKDFATEPDESCVQRAAHAMVQPLASNLAVVTCKEPLCNGIISILRFNLTKQGLPEQLADEIANTIANENIELMCVYIEQLTQAKALENVDRQLTPAYANRATFKKQVNRSQFFDVLSLTVAPHSIQMPDLLRPTHGITPDHLRLYENFGQGSYMAVQQQQQRPLQPQPPQPISPLHFHPEAQQQPPLPQTPQQFIAPDSPMAANGARLLTAKLEQMLLELDRLIRQCGISDIAQLPPNHDICLLIRQIPLLASQSTTPRRTMITFVEKVVFMFYQSSTSFALEIYTMFLQSLFEVSGEVTKETLSWLIYADDERKYNPPAIAMLIRYELLPLEEYDVQLAKLINAKADSVIEFAAGLMRLCLLSPNPTSCLEDHILTVSSLMNLVKNDEAPASVISLIDDLRKAIEAPYSDIKHDRLDCLELRMLFAEWARLCQHPMAVKDIRNTIIETIMKRINDEEEDVCFIFRLYTEACVNQYLTSKITTTIHHRRMIHLIDSYTKLVSAMIAQSVSFDKLKLLNHALSVIILILSHHHQSKGIHFNQKPFLRLLFSLFHEVSKLNLKEIDRSVVIVFSDALYTLQPSNFPGFAFSWLQLIASRTFLPQLLVGNDKVGWKLCQKLVEALLKFLGPLLDCKELSRGTRIFYRGTLRALVILLHDFPEFVCHNYLLFAQTIPYSCVQLRNLILSAFPRTMHLPDPFTPDLKLSLLPECTEDPTYDDSYSHRLLSSDFRAKIDEFIQDKGQYSGFYKVLENEIELEDKLCRSDVLSMFVIYIGAKVASLKLKTEENPAIFAYEHLLSKLGSSGRYTVLNAISDNLRYPNSHTLFFSSSLLYLFTKQPEAVKEQITRVLLERLIVNRPHPWGLLATFIELIKNPNFWKHDFIRCSPDIERLFDNVSRSIKQTVVATN